MAMAIKHFLKHKIIMLLTHTKFDIFAEYLKQQVD